jgi:hypothetical protein
MNRERYLFLCKELDRILIKTQVRKNCIECSINSPKGGCCKGCAHLTKTGCDTVSASCKAFLCYEIKHAIHDSKYEGRWSAILHEFGKAGMLYSYDYPGSLDVCFRESVDEAFLSRKERKAACTKRFHDYCTYQEEEVVRRKKGAVVKCTVLRRQNKRMGGGYTKCLLTSRAGL